MSANLQYNFEAIGVRNVERALASIERRVIQHNAKIMRGVGAKGSTGGGIGKVGKSSTSDVTRGFDQIARAARAANLKEERDKIRSVHRIEQVKLRSDQKIALARERLERQDAARSLARQKRAALAEIAVQKATARARAQFVSSTVGRGAGRVAGAVGSVGRTGAMMMGIGGAAVAGNAVSESVKLEDRVRRLTIAGRQQGATGMDPKALQKQIVSTGIATGKDPAEIEAGLAAYTRQTGDLKSGVANMETFATVAQAADSSVAEIADTAAQMAIQFDIKSIEDVSQAFADLAFQGKKGSFELKDMAEQFPSLASAAKRAGMSGSRGLKDLGALAQIARTSTGSGAEAGTAVETMLTKLQAEGKNLQSGKALGGNKVQVFKGGDATAGMRNVPDVIADVIAESGGDITKLQSIFDVRGIRAVSPMIAKFREINEGVAYKTDKDTGEITKDTSRTVKKQGKEAGRAAIMAMITDAAETGAKFTDLQADAAEAMKSTAVQLEILNTKIKDAISSALMPELVKLIPEITKLVPLIGQAAKKFVDVIKWLSDNPWTGVGAALATAVGYEVGKAALGQIIASAVTRMLAAQVAASAGGAGAIGAARAGLAAGGVAGTVGAGVAAVGGVALAVDQAMSLAKESGGWGGIGAGIGGLFSGKGFFGGMDEYQNQQARDDAAKRLPPVSPEIQLQALGERLEKAGIAQEEAAKQLSAAAVKLGIRDPHRGNGPSPVKQ